MKLKPITPDAVELKRQALRDLPDVGAVDNINDLKKIKLNP